MGLPAAMLRKLIIPIILLAGAGGPVSGLAKNAAEIAHTPIAVASGGISTQAGDAAEGSVVNPALLPFYNRQGGVIGGGYAPSYYSLFGHYFIPGSLGTLGMGAGYFTDSYAEAEYRFAYLNIGYAKEITRKLNFGFYLKPVWGDNAAGSFVGIGIEPAFYYNTRSSIDFGAGFGLYDFGFYMMPRNLAFNFGEGSELAPDISLHFGMQSDIFREESFSTRLYTETYGIGDFTTAPVHSGIAFKYSIFSLRAGYMYSDYSALFSGFSAGAGIDYKFENGNLAVNYGILPRMGDRVETYHFISASGTYGTIDREPPMVELKSDVAAFSPDFDGRSDYVHFNIKVDDASPIKDWQLKITDSDGNIVREFKNDTRYLDDSLSVGRFFEHFFSSEESLVVPQTIRWDGTANQISIAETVNDAGEAVENRQLTDGVYSYSFTVIDIHGNRSPEKQGNVLLDTTAPGAEIAPEKYIFSPNGDGVYDKLTILHDVTGEPGDFWSGEIKTEAGDTVITRNWRGSDIPGSFVWDGNYADSRKAPEGIYTYVLTGKDRAGNFFRTESRKISLVRARDSVELELSADGLSPNDDNISDKLTITPGLNNREGLSEWILQVTSEKPEKDGEIQGLVREWVGRGADSIPEKFTWNGTNGSGVIVEDGLYYITMRLEYRSGNNPVSLAHPVVVDKTPPLIGVEADLRIFSPDGDGENEEQVFRLDIEDESKLKSYGLNIYEIQYDDKNRRTRIPFKKFSGRSEYPQKIFWEGKSDKGALVESATFYEYELSAEDVYGNKETSATGRFETDILVLVTDRGLKIRLSNIEFAFGRAEIRPKAKPLLNRLSHVLQRYPEYKIRVEGHTDNKGTEDYNLSLSEKRAQKVMNYLIQSGLSEKRISYQGMGEVYPLLPNDSWYNRSRNRRVEFILIKD